MMKLELNQTIDVEILKEELKSNFTHYKVKNAPFNKKTLRITNGMSQVVVGQKKNLEIICVGNLNLLDVRLLIPFVLGMSFFLIGGLIFMIVMMRIKKKEYTSMEAEIGEFLQDSY